MTEDHCTTRRLGMMVRAVTAKVEDFEFQLGLEHVEGWTGRLLESESVFESDGVAFAPGDILFGKLRPYLAKVWVADRPGAAVGDFLVLRPRPGTISRFLAWSLLRSESIAEISAAVYGSKMPRVSWEILREVSTPAPPARSQSEIAQYLDRETAEIDAFIADQEELIALFNERRLSVIEAHLPRPDETAPVVPLKAVADLQAGLTLGKEYPGEPAFPYLRVANVQAGELNLAEVKSVQVPPAVARAHMLRLDDVLMTEGGDFDKLGRGALWSAEIPECLHQNHVFAVRCRQERLLPAYLAYMLETSSARAYFTATGKQSTNLASTNSTIVRNLRLAIPSVVRQQAVLISLESVTKRLSASVRDARKAISLAKERRGALITAAVTGKVDVTARKRMHL